MSIQLTINLTIYRIILLKCCLLRVRTHQLLKIIGPKFTYKKVKKVGDFGPLALILKIFRPETLFGKYLGMYHFLGTRAWRARVPHFSVPTWHLTLEQKNLKNKLGTRAHEARVPLSGDVGTEIFKK